MKTENNRNPRIILTNEGKSSYSDGLLWVPIGGLEEGNGRWLKPGERIAILPPLPKLGLSQPPAEAADRLESALHLLRQIMQDLPQKRDWLNPDLERSAKALISLDQVTSKPRENFAYNESPNWQK
jgi:hypothetical protein